jgi:hypothetical protein
MAQTRSARSKFVQERLATLLKYFGYFLWFIVIIVLPLVIDFTYPKMIPLLCWVNLSIICNGNF